MLRFLLRSSLSRLALLVAASIIAHTIVHLAPGDPNAVDPMNPAFKPEDVALIRAAFHLEEPLYLQYLYWIKDLACGDLRAFSDNQPVLTKIVGRFKNSIPLFLAATVIIWTISFPVGILAALRRGSLLDRASTITAFAFISVPSFALAFCLIIASVNAIGLPALGMNTFGLENASWWTRLNDKIWHLALPALASALTGVAILSRYVRTQMLEVINQDYMRTARAKGLEEDLVIYRHGLRNTLLPFITLFGLMLPGLVSGSVVIEYVFAWPGIGRLGYEAILARDYPVVLTLNLFAAALTLAGTFISDLLYAAADPRLRS